MPPDNEGEPQQQRFVHVRGKGRKGAAEPAESSERPSVPPTPAAVSPSVAHVHSQYDELPPDDHQPEHRMGPSIGLITLTDEGRQVLRANQPLDIPGADSAPPDLSDDKMRTLDDLMGRFPIGASDGQYYVTVERKQPTSYLSQSTKGIMRPIRRRMNMGDFIAEYGGGSYDLIVYGPPRRAGVPDEITGRVRAKALTQPVKITIPYGNYGYPPNFEAVEVEDENMMNGGSAYRGDPQGALPFGLPSRGAVTPATAQVVKAQLDHNETMDERERRDRSERRREQRAEENSALAIFTRQSERREAELQRQIERMTEQLDARDKEKKPSELEGLAAVLGVMHPQASRDELQSLRDGHTREIERLEKVHRAELDTVRRGASEERDRVQQQARDEISRVHTQLTELQRRADEKIADYDRRIEREGTQVKNDIERRERDLKESHSREIEFVRQQAQATIDQQRVTHETVLSSERRQQERELQSREQMLQGKLETEKATLLVQIEGYKADNKRRERDVEELRKAAEKNKDLGKMLDDVRKNAEMLGLVKDEGGDAEPQTWQQTALQVLTEGMKHLPQIISSAGQAIGNVRGGAPAQQQRPTPQLPPPQQQRMYQLPPGMQMPMPQPRQFASEYTTGEPPAGPDSFGAPQGGVTPTPMEQPYQAQQMPVAMQQPQPQQMVMASPYQPNQQPVAAASAPAAPPTPIPIGPGAQPALQPQLATTPSSPPPAAGPSTPPPPPTMEPDPTADSIVLSVRERLLESAFEQRATPEEVVKIILNGVDPEEVKKFLPILTPNYVIGAIERNQVRSRLASRAGRRYLGEVHQALTRVLTQGQPES